MIKYLHIIGLILSSFNCSNHRPVNFPLEDGSAFEIVGSNANDII